MDKLRAAGRLCVLLGLAFVAAPANAETTLNATPTTITKGQAVTATWSGIPTPTTTDWVGLYTPGAPNSNSVTWRFTNGAASGSLPLTVPTSAASGTYELRLFPNSTYTSIATSNSFTVTTTPAVSGTVTAGGSPLSGVTFAATNGGTCTASNASGQYSCSVPTGWSGTVTPSLSDYTFSPASRSYNNLTASQSGQDFTAATAVAMYFIHPDHLNTPRVITNQSAQVVWRWDHAEPFGTNPVNENPSGLGVFECNLRLPGQYFDKETNLHYNYFRDYDPATGRYPQFDLIGLAGGINGYAYVGNNPLKFSDPYGLQAAAGGAAGAGGSSGLGVGGAIGGSGARPNTPSGGEVIPFPGGRERPTARPERPGTESSSSMGGKDPREDCDCPEWKRRLLELRENIILLEQITGRVDLNSRGNFALRAREYNVECARVTGHVPETILYVVQ